MSYLKFKSVPKAQKEELIQWIIRYCDLFRFFDKSPFFLKKIKIEISEEIEGRKLFIRENDDDVNKYFYIVKSGNAFSWLGLDGLNGGQKGALTEKLAREVQGEGMIGEIFCEGDLFYPGLELFENPFLQTTKKADYLQYFSQKKGNIVSGTPFDNPKVPLVLIKIGAEEFQKLIFGKELLAKIAKMFLHYLYFKLITNRWKLWGQWTNDTELKLLSILYLYFIGELPLRCWTTADKGETINIKDTSLKKPRCLIKEFEVGLGNLVIFVGLTRQAIADYLRDSKGIVAKSDFSELGVDIDDLFKNLKKNNYIDADGVIQDKFYKLGKKLKGRKPRGYSGMSLNLPYGSKKEQIYTILQQSPKKTALERNEKLASLLNYKDPFQRKLEFSSPSPLKLLSYIQSEILSSAINKNK